MNKKVTEPQIVLYELGGMGSLNFISATEEAFNKIISNMKVPYCKLEYFRELDGVKDVIKYSKMDKNNNIISYYTIRDNDVITGLMVDDEINWSYNDGMFNFILIRFKAFKDMGIVFNYDGLNQLTDSSNNKNNKLSRVRRNR